MGAENRLKKSASDSGPTITTRLNNLNASEMLLEVQEDRSSNFLDDFDKK